MIAAPLILPFAELAGITIAGLGMAAASQKVGDFISDNPELSKQILTTLLPGGVGLNTLFKKEAGITLEDVEEMTDEEAADLSKEDKAKIMKEVGKSKGGDKRQRMIDISEKLGLSGKGKEEQDFVDEIEERYEGTVREKKPTFDYKKFFRNRNADGGAIGIEVLFQEKKDGGRIGFANGGENIIGADLKDSFFNKLYGQDKIANLEAQYGLGGSGKPSQARHQAAVNELSKNLNIGNINTFGPGNLFTALAASATEIPDVIRTGDIKESARDIFDNLKGALVTDKSKTPADIYRDVYKTPTNQQTGIMKNISDLFFAPAGASEIQSPTTVRADYERAPNTAFAELLAQTPTPQSLNQFDNIINTGVNQRPRLTDRIKSGIETVGNKLGSFGDYIKGGGIFGNIISGFGSRGDQSTRGIAGLNLQDVFNIDSFGSDEDPTKDPYGINIVSRFGNYKDYVTQKARELAQRKFRTDSANKRKDFYQQAFEKIQEQQRIEQAAQRARDKLRSEAAYATQTGDDSPYTGGFDPSTGNYDDPFSPGDTE